MIAAENWSRALTSSKQRASPHFSTAAKFVDQHTLGLYAGDALHLAVAAEHGATVRTLDQRLAAARSVLGVMTTLLA